MTEYETTASEMLATALAKAQGEMSNAPLNKVNPHFKSKYADLASIRDATVPHLSANGLSIVQTTHENVSVNGEAGSMFLRTTLMHTGGGTVVSTYPLPLALDKPQVMGSALTYARRYCWAAMCGIAAEEDDDANAASKGTNASQRAQSSGPLTITKLKEGLREISGDLDNCDDLGTLAGIKEKAKPILMQAKRDLPDWHEAAQARIDNLDTELNERAALTDG